MKINHPVWSSAPWQYDKEEERDAALKGMSQEEYQHLLGGNFEEDVRGSDVHDNLSRQGITSSPHNTPENNKIALNHLLNHMKTAKSRDTLPNRDGMDDHGRTLSALDDKLKEFVNHIPLDKETLKNFINNKYNNPQSDKYSFKRFDVEKQPNLTPEMLKDIHDNHGDRWDVESIPRHPAFNQDLANHLIDSQNITPLTIREIVGRANRDPNVKINDSHIKKLLDDKSISDHHGTKGMLLNAASPEFRSNRIDRLIGLEGGEKANDDDESGWNNWNTGDDYDPKFTEHFAEHGDLTPHQIEHIKRHGSHEEKVALLNNPKVDTAHHLEMINKWSDDDSEDGYDLDDYRKTIKDAINDSGFHNTQHYDQATEEVQEAYPMHEYISDNYDEDDRANLWLGADSKKAWMENYMSEQGWLGDHEDDPESHPDYNDLEEKADKAFDQAVNEADTPGRVYEHYDEWNRNQIYDKANDLLEESLEDPFSSYEHLPDHLHGKIPNIEEREKAKRDREAAKAAEEQAAKDRAHVLFLDSVIPNRPSQHEYGEGQHHIEMAKKYADANGGSIDIGTLNKKHPNLVNTWKQVFGKQGKLSSQELDQKLQTLPKDKFNVSYGKWGGNQMQNLNGQDEVVFRLDHSPDSIKELQKDPEVFDTFRKIQDLSQRSGHPTNFNTIGWARVDMSNPKHPIIDETQSDFSSTARDYLKENGGSDKAEHIDKIMKVHKNWRENLINLVINTAKANGAEKISTHSPESKSAHTGASKVHSVYKDSYQKVPRSMGFAASNYNTLPLTEKGKYVFLKDKNARSDEDRLADHLMGMNLHAIRWHHHNDLATNPSDAALTDSHKALAEHHSNKYKQHHAKLTNIDPTQESSNQIVPSRRLNFMMYQPDFHDRSIAVGDALQHSKNPVNLPEMEVDSAIKEEPAAVQAHPAHTLDLTDASMKKFEIYKHDLKKAMEQSQDISQLLEPIMQQLNSPDSAKIMEQIQRNSPDVFNALMAVFDIIGEEYGKHEDAQEEEPAPQTAQQSSPDPSLPQSRATKDEPITHPKPVYAPGSVREYNPQDVRIKGQDGDWSTLQTETAPQEGQSGEQQ